MPAPKAYCNPISTLIYERRVEREKLLARLADIDAEIAGLEQAQQSIAGLAAVQAASK